MQQIRRKKRKRRYAAPIGGVFAVLALIGIIAVMVGSINLTGRVLDNSSEKEKLENLIRPVLMFNPIPFESVEDIEPQQLLLFSMWANLASEKRETYQFDENAELIVPASDLEVAAVRLFGPDVELEHQSFGDYQTLYYYYDPERNIYNVPISAQLYVYSPQVEDIEREGRDLYNVTVGYIPAQGSAWNINTNPEPDKEMIYVMRKVRRDYYIVALRDPPSVLASAVESVEEEDAGAEAMEDNGGESADPNAME